MISFSRIRSPFIMRIAKNIFLVTLALSGFALAGDASAMSAQDGGWPDWIGTIEDLSTNTPVSVERSREEILTTTRAGTIPEYYRPLHYRQLAQPTSNRVEVDANPIWGSVDTLSSGWPLWIDRPDWIR